VLYKTIRPLLVKKKRSLFLVLEKKYAGSENRACSPTEL
jgi:hypothetical protein